MEEANPVELRPFRTPIQDRASLTVPTYLPRRPFRYQRLFFCRKFFLRGDTPVILLLFLLWMLLAGQFDLEVLLTGAAVAVLGEFLAQKTLGYGSRWIFPTPRRVWGSVRYLARLLWEMLVAGIAVMRLIYARGREVEPLLVWFRTDLKTTGARASLADSITLTAGTITVEAENGRMCVHALDRSLAKGIEDTCFARQLQKLEELK